jgi:hypothetical protein
VAAVVETLRDLTDEKQAQMALEKLVTSDGLGIPAQRDRPFRSNVTADSGPS